MASGKIKGITVEIGGDTTKLGKAISEVDKQSNSLKGELKQVEKLLKMDPGNMDLIAQKQEILTRAVSDTSDKLKILKEAQEQVEEQFKNGKIDEGQYRAFQRELIKTSNELNDLEGELKDTDEALDKAGKGAKDSGEGFTIMKGALADMVADVITTAISSIGNLVGSLLELSEATEEYRQMQAKLEGSSKTFGYSMDFAKGKYEEFYKYLGDDQASTNAITNLMGIGTSTESVSKLAEGATAVWASYGDSIPIEGLTEAINETITVGKVTGGMADTINWAKNANEGLNNALSGNKEAQKAYNDAIKEGLPVEDAFNEALAKITDEQERADVVAKFLNGTYGDSKKTYDEMAGSILDANKAELDLKETQAKLGEAVAPVNTAITNLKSQALEAILPVVEKVSNAFLNLLTWFKEHPTATKILTAVVIALATAFGVLATALAIQGIISGVTKAIAFLNTTLLANPIVLIIALITGLVAGFIYLWNNCDAFREFWINLWKKIKSFCSTAITGIKNFVTKTMPEIINNIINWFKQLPKKVSEWLTNTINKVKTWASNMKNKATETGRNFINNIVDKVKQIPSKVYNALKGCYAKVTSWGSSMTSKAKSAVSKVVTGISDKLKTAVSKVKSIGGDIVRGLWNGIGDKVGWIKDKLAGFKDSVMNALKNFFGIHSPSRLMRDEIGYNLSAGIAEGIDSGEPVKAVDKLSNDILNGVGDINGATINRKLNTTFSVGSAGVGKNNDLLNRLDSIYDRLNRLQIVLDTGTLVGETVDAYDQAFANRKTQLARGW